MAFRGRGRGRGRGGFGLRLNGPASYTPYENFPDVEKLPDLAAIIHSSKELKEMAIRESQLDEFWRGSCYHLQEDALRAKKETETGRILGKRRKTQERREALAFYLKLTPSNFPGELIQGSRQVQQSNKKLKWDRHADHISLDKFEKLEEKHKDKDEKEDEDEEEEPEEEEPEESSDDDYNQNVDFDDDEDDMNMVEADEDYYE